MKKKKYANMFAECLGTLAHGLGLPPSEFKGRWIDGVVPGARRAWVIEAHVRG